MSTQMTNILQYLETTSPSYPNKVAFTDGITNLTFAELQRQSISIGSALHRDGYYKQPVVVFMEKSPSAIAAFFGAVYAGCYYIPLDKEMPRHRIELILGSLQPGALICDNQTETLAAQLPFNGSIYRYDDLAFLPQPDTAGLQEVRDRQLDIDPIYIVFTSGSTGVPKGVIACHRSVIDYMENLWDVLRPTAGSIFGNQTPLYFDACLKEIISTIKYGATTHLIPKQLFMFPEKLVRYLNEHRINTICWVVSALTMISSFKTFRIVVPEHLHTIAFASEVFPIKQFNLWKAALPQARFINLYGPTETTGICCYYEADRDFSEGEVMPVGKPFPNTEILLLNDKNELAAPGEQGEICIRGTRLTLGYYCNPEKTAEVFVQNPLNPLWPDLIYRTGDIGQYNDRGELMFVSRKDHQIKHMGHRIELGEIEAIVSMHDKVQSCCCIYLQDVQTIVLFYVGDPSPSEMTTYIKEKLPRYMVPNVTRRLLEMPYTPNGKVDRKLLSSGRVTSLAQDIRDLLNAPTKEEE